MNFWTSWLFCTSWFLMGLLPIWSRHSELVSMIRCWWSLTVKNDSMVSLPSLYPSSYILYLYVKLTIKYWSYIYMCVIGDGYSSWSSMAARISFGSLQTLYLIFILTLILFGWPLRNICCCIHFWWFLAPFSWKPYKHIAT